MENQMFVRKLPDAVDVPALESVENSPMLLPCRIYWSMLQKEFLR